LAFTPKSSQIIDAMIAALTDAGVDGRLTEAILDFTRHSESAITRYPAAYIWCFSEESRDSAHILVDGIYEIQIYVSHANPEFSADKIRQMAHEVRAVLMTDKKATAFADVGVRWTLSFRSGYDEEQNVPVGGAKLGIHLKYKEQR